MSSSPVELLEGWRLKKTTGLSLFSTFASFAPSSFFSLGAQAARTLDPPTLRTPRPQNFRKLRRDTSIVVPFLVCCTFCTTLTLMSTLTNLLNTTYAISLNGCRNTVSVMFCIFCGINFEFSEDKKYKTGQMAIRRLKSCGLRTPITKKTRHCLVLKVLAPRAGFEPATR